MAGKKKINKNNYRAYWMGVGAGLARYTPSGEKIFTGDGKISKSFLKGMHDDNYRDKGKQSLKLWSQAEKKNY